MSLFGGIIGGITSLVGGIASIGNKAPKAPDLNKYTDAAYNAGMDAFQIARDNLQKAYDEAGNNLAMLGPVIGQQVNTMNKVLEGAFKDRRAYEQTYYPALKALQADYQTYASGDRIQQERSRAMGDVNAAADAGRANSERMLTDAGVNISDVKFGALDRGLRLQQAAMAAGAGNTAAINAENTGRALRSELMNQGQGAAQLSQSGAELAARTGNSAVQGGLALTESAQKGRLSALPYMGMGLEGVGQAANTVNAGYQNAISNWNMDNERIDRIVGFTQQAGNAFDSGMGSNQGGGGWFGNQSGGAIPEDLSPRPGARDSVPAMLEPGEYVVPRKLVEKLGTNFFEKLKEKHTPELANKTAIPARKG